MDSTSSGVDKDALLYNSEVCAALGMYPGSGCCVRHPTMPILLISDNDSSIIQSCSACESEYCCLLSGGKIRRRPTFVSTIMQTQKLHNDKQGWDEFKQNWEQASSEENNKEVDAGEEKK